MSVKINLMRYAGSMQQAAYIRPVTYSEGRAGGLRAYDVKNGPMSFRILADKCLDVGEFSYAGVNMSFLSKPGLQGREPYGPHGLEGQRSIMGGLFFTAGTETIGAPCTVGGMDLPLHGWLRSIPGEHLSADAFWDGDGYRLRASGEMRSAMLFGENLVLRRAIETVYGSKTLTVTDEFENETFRSVPLMLLYHVNLGWPFLDEHLRLHIPTRKVAPRDADAEGHEDRYDRMEPPKDGEPERVFLHDLNADAEGRTEVIAVNGPLGLGLRIAWDARGLPYFIEWKSVASGDYVIGLEPANSSIYGRAWHEERGTVHHLAPLATERHVLTFTVLDGTTEIDAAVAAFEDRYLKKETS